MLSPRNAAAAEPIDPAVWTIAMVLILGSVLVVLDTTIVNVALEPLTEQLNAGLDRMQWVVTGYLLAIAAVIPLTGWAARRFSPKRVYLSSMALFTAGSLLCGLAQSVDQLIAFRVLQGLGGGAIPPVGQLILVRVAGQKNLPRVMSSFGVPMVLAPVFGPTLGGLLVEHVDWRWIFFVNVPLGVVAVFAGHRLLPSDPREPTEGIDVAGLMLVVLGLVALTYGLSEMEGASGALEHAILPSAVGVLLIGAFVVRSLRSAHPLLDMRVYADRVFRGAAVASFFLGSALVATSILMPLYLQSVRGLDAMDAGLLTTPRGLGATLGTWLSGRLMHRIGTGRTALVGAAALLVLTSPYVLLDAHTSYAFIIVTGIVQGTAIGMSIMPAMTAGYRSLRPDQIADATPQLNIVQRVGSSVGVAVLIGILQHGLRGTGESAESQAQAFSTSFGWLLVVIAPAVAAAALLAVLERRDASAEPPVFDDAAASPLLEM